MHTLLERRPGKGRAWAFLSLLCLLLTANAFATDYYVATTGNDATNNGRSSESPYATVQKAADVAVAGDIVYVMAGTYREQIEIKSDGVTFRPYGSDKVIFNGADLMLNWTPFSGSTYQTTMNWELNQRWGSNQLFQDGRMIDLARWPDQTSTDLVMPTNGAAEDVVIPPKSGGNYGNWIEIRDDQFNEPAARWVGAKIWVNLSRGNLSGLDGQGWTGTVHSIRGNIIRVEGISARPSNEAWGVGPGTEYFLFDPLPAAVEATGGVDALLGPGEWWKNGNTLYVKTRSGAAPASSAEATSNLIEAKRRYFAFWPAVGNRAGYTIENFHLFGCAITTDRNAISSRRIADEANNITLSGLTVKYPSHLISMAGNWQDEHYNFTGIVLSGRNNVLKDSDISLSATSAVSFSGANNKLLNNRIHETNYMCSNSGAVNTGFVCKDSEIAYNKIWNTTMMGINIKFLKGSNPEVKHTARVHHNEIWDFMRRSFDSSAIDVVGEDLEWVRIDHNIIYNTLADARRGGRKYGIYLDFGGGPDGLNRVRATVDHNVVWDVNNPMTLNTGWDVHIFNNVFLAVEDKTDADETPGQWREVSRSLSINLDLGKGPKAGTNVLVYNNILSEAPSFAYGNQDRVNLLNNITNARGAVLGELFVNATNPVMSARNYRLKETALAAIDKGISVDEFTENYVLDSDVQGITDIGAYEWGTFLTGPDTEAPSVPAADKFVVSEMGASSFRLTWRPSTDNVGVAFYEVYANGKLFKQTGDTTLLINGLTLSTTYRVAVLAVDASANRSELSGTVEAKTILNHVTISQTEVAPATDGTLDAAYGPLLPVANVLTTAPASPADASGGWTSLWDANNLYIYMDVNDDRFTVDSGSAWWEDDHIELYIDANGTRPTGYSAMQYQYAVVRGASSIINAKPWFNRPTTGIVVSNVEKPNGAGYTVEIKIPFATLGVTGDAYKFIGIDVQIGDDDDGGSEDTRMGWHATINNVHQNPSLMAIAQLVEKGAGDNIKPSVPTEVRASAIMPKEFLLTWAASVDNVGVLSYEVFVNGNLVATPTGTSLTLNELTPGATYAVQVVAKDRFGNLSAPSSMLRVTTPTRDSGVKYESERATFAGAVSVSRAESGFSGTGYAVMSPSIGATITYAVTVPKAGVYPVSIVYSGDSRVFPYINGTRLDEFRLPGTPTPNDWREVTRLFTLRAGANTIGLRYESGDFWRTSNHDFILIYPTPGGDSEAPGVPSDLHATNVTNRSFTLNWAAAADDSGIAPKYDVFSNGNLLGSSATTAFNVTSLLPGTTYRMTVKAKDAAGSESDASAVLFVTTSKAGAVIREYWANVGGTAISGIPVNTTPTSTSALYSLEDPTPSLSSAEHNNFGQRIRGYIIPSRTATYFFYIAADNTGEFWLSTDDQPANKGTAPTAQVKNTKAREWDKELRGQKSAGMALVAGKKYYFEALMKEFDGGNNLSIGWTTDTRNKGITVIDGDNLEAYVVSQEVASVSVSPATHSMVTGATKVLTAIVAPEDATNPSVNWTSSNPAVATVNRMGLVTAVGIGTATITATSADGTGKTASSVITVSRDWTKVDDNEANSGIVYDSNWRVWAGNTRNYRSTEHFINDKTLLSEATFTFTGARVRYYGYTRYDLGIADVYLNGVKVATVDLYGQNGEEVYQKVLWDSGELPYGRHILTIKATNSTNQSPNRLERHKSNNIVIDAFEYSTHALCTTCRTASASPEKRAVSAGELGLKLQPNPADRQVTIDLSGFAGESAVQVQMTDMSGKLHVTRQVEPGEAGKQVTVPVSHLPKGLFVVTVQGSKTTRRAKLVIAR